MDANIFKDLVMNLGFPIVMCAGLFVYIWKRSEAYDKKISELKQEYKDDMKEMREHYEKKLDEINREHKEEVSKLSESLDNNTQAMERLADIMEVERRLKHDES